MSAVEEKSAATAPAEQQKTDDKPAAAATEAVTKAPESEAPKPEADSAASEQAKPEGGDAAATATTADETKAAADGDKKEDEKSNRPRLIGAARNRFRWFVKNGYGRDEAAELAQDPEKIKEIKEQRGLNGNGKRPANGSGNDGPANKQAKLANGPIRMVVATEKHPGEKLTADQVNQIKSAILKQVVLQKDSIDVKPHFEDCSFVDGYLLVQCSDGPTVKWLQDVVPKLELWENANVKVSSEKFLQRADIYVGTFADSLQDSDKDILSFVESQNEGIAASGWTILGRKENKPKKEVELILTMDVSSGKQVLKQKFELNYKFSKVTLKKRKRIAGPPQNNNANIAQQRANPNRQNQNPRRIYNAATSFVPIWDNNLPGFNGGQQRFNNNNRGFNANRGPPNNPNFRNQQRPNNNGNAFGLGVGPNGPRGNNQRAGNNRQPRSLIDQLMQTVNSTNNGNMGQRRGPNNGNPSFNGGNAGGGGGGGGGRPFNRNNRSRGPRPGFF